MFDLDNWQEIWHTLKSNKLRTALTAFGVFWGIFMLVIMLGAGNGLRNGVFQGFGDFSTNSMFMWTQKTSIPYKGYQRDRWFPFKNADTKALKQNIPEIDLIAPRIEETSIAMYENNTGSYRINGDYPDINKIDPVSITAGRFINQLDINEERKVAVIGKKVKEDLFIKNADPINKYIKINGVYYKVVGTFKSKKLAGQADWENQQIFIPFSTMQKVNNLGDIIYYYAITAKKGHSVSSVEEKAIALMKQRHDVAPDDMQAIGHFNVEEQFNKMVGLFTGIALLSWIVGIGTLLSGVIGVSNIMLVIVRERTKEIGIMRAIGAKPILIIRQIVSESIFLTSLAGYFGLMSGILVIEMVNKMLAGAATTDEPSMFVNPEIDIKVATVALLILIASGTIAGFLPAKRAISIKPIDALRSEI